MPHLTVEYSANLDNQIDILKLIEAVHQAALGSGASKWPRCAPAQSDATIT